MDLISAYYPLIYDATIYTLNSLRYLFYLVLPSETMFEKVEYVPRYVAQMFPIFVLIGFAENGVRLLQGRKILRPNDTIASLSQGIFQESFRIHLRSFEVITYCFVYEHFRLISLPWDSHLTWCACLIGVDLAFYVYHRLSHEVNIMWAVHQAHHSNEDFTMVSALRQAAIQPFAAWFSYLPLALCIPPSIFLTHLQLSELYMIWIHTEVIQTLGPLEYILNTPSHHRVHHGRNRKYIDKNYAGTFIIWDRLFGTFQPEDPDDPVVYGLVHPVQSYNPFYLQFHHWAVIVRNFRAAQGWKHKLSVLFKGPGWAPGKPRLGNIEDIPELQHPVTYWSPQISLFQNVYTIWHFGMILIYYYMIVLHHHSFHSQLTVTSCVLALLFSITSFGFLLEGREFAWGLELVRCVSFLFLDRMLLSFIKPFSIIPFQTIRQIIRLTFKISALLCVINLIQQSIKYYLNKKRSEDFNIISSINHYLSLFKIRKVE